MLGGLRMEKSLWLRRSKSGRGTSCYRMAYATLSHCSRTFQHKTRRAPQSSSLEKFRAATTTPLTATRFLHTAQIDVHPGGPSTFGFAYRFYSQSSTLRAMAEVKWTGPRVRKAFLDYFAERGHSIGKESPPLPRDAFRCASVCAHAALAPQTR